MTRLGFAIDHRACIGCHACTVACKMEHDVPLGVFRTWVKYIEKGSFPDAKRYFSVLRCNHCTDAPCINICPTNALFKRENGIVDFDNSVCIGCKACMQACPYDALYIDPVSQTAAKCNFCAHRVETGLEPACVIVCPTHAIVAGDLDDPVSEISRLVAMNATQVRAPEQGTGPNVLYIGADEAAITPTMTNQPESYIWAELNPTFDGQTQPRFDDAEAKARTVYDADHPMPWGWKVSAYLWTKSIAAGVAIVAAVAMLMGNPQSPLLATYAPAIALGALAVTGVLLIVDLKQPKRFLYIFLKGNPKSWLVRGAWAIAIYGGVLTLWLGARVFGWHGVITALRWPVVPIGALAAAYTGWLFGQAEGRDLWQSPLLAWILLAQAAIAGAGTLLIASFAGAGDPRIRPFLGRTIVGAAALWALMTLVEMSHTSHSTQQARRAARNLIRGPYARLFWGGAALGMLAPVALGAAWLAGGHDAMLAIGAASGLIGLVVYEHGFVLAGQSVPLS